MTELTYEDYKRRVNIQEVLRDAGYVLNRKDGLRYPSYVRLGSDGRRVRGDKFIVTANGLCCFQPPERKNYNVISFIKEHPGLFSEYTPGMSKDRLVNLVCRRLLNMPPEERKATILNPDREAKPFRLQDYECQHLNLEDKESLLKFYPYFKSRGIGINTQRTFSDYFFLATKTRADGKQYTNLSFPMVRPDNPNGIVGLEERGRAFQSGGKSFKGMATGSDATHGMWIAGSDRRAMSDIRDVYWFESAYDAMAFYQLHSKEIDFDSSLFVSTGGSPSQQQFKGMLNATPSACHHLCFDRDRAGQVFAINFALTSAGRLYSSHITKDGNLVVLDSTEKFQRHEIALEPFDFDRIMIELGISTGKRSYPQEQARYVESLTNPADIFSGDAVFLEGKAGELYGEYESLAEEYHSELHSRLVCQEDLEDTKEQMRKAYREYREAMQETFADYNGGNDGLVIQYEKPKDGYKDWNDQLLDKKMEEAEENRDNSQEEEQRHGFKR